MFGATVDPSVVPDWMSSPQSASASAETDFGLDRMLDLVFIIDATGSMGSYINSATRNIETICDNIVHSELLSRTGALRVGLISYRDHPPQDHVYIVRNFGFTDSVLDMKENLNSLFAAGGGDGPEAATAALKAVTVLDWRPQAAKMAVLVTDAPPHGIGEYGDGFPNGSPDGEDPIVLARAMSAKGITLFVVACEPALSGYQHAVDFYHGLVNITGGILVPLTTASLLSHVVIAAAGEVMDLDRLHREVGDAVLERLCSLSITKGEEADTQATDPSAKIVDQIAHELHEKLLLRNESTKQLIVESIYRESEESTHNIAMWTRALDVSTARPHIRKVVGSRLSQKFIDARRTAQHSTSPPRPESTAGPMMRHIITDFSSFQAEPGVRIQDTGAGRADYATFRSGAADMDDDDDAFMADTCAETSALDNEIHVHGENGQRLSYRHDAISLSQARRLAWQSVSRAA
ncbi:hypothetical protein MVES1_001847 [Malassezia vespertilionis]|uniref:uncharacterized protein n=1 Tax=Malassezia vespertilionis TaxID=2020962 RepID=UPI0024B27904|nr:uncharacterized protein MVES1_001847 [Malassezia vespertilionis]WFD06500.1 hypothetical protein MVES1_001847 [Malassezia vespertilionis]